MVGEKTIILVNESRMAFEPIMDVIEEQRLTENAFYTQKAEEALNHIPENGSCLVITESLVPNNKGKGTDGVRYLLSEGKKKNPECQFILYTADAHDLETKEFHLVIYSNKRGEYQRLLDGIANFCNQKLRKMI